MHQTVFVPVRFCDRLPSLCPWTSMKISAVLQSHLGVAVATSELGYPYR